MLLHGFGASTYSWRKVMPALAASHRVVAIDLNGFGYTQRPNARASYTREAQAQLVLGTLDALGIDRAHFVGHSYGGGLTLYLASQHPERFRTMVLVDSSAPTYANDRRSRAAAFRPLDSLLVRAWCSCARRWSAAGLLQLLLRRLPGHPRARPGLPRPPGDRGGALRLLRPDRPGAAGRAGGAGEDRRPRPGGLGRPRQLIAPEVGRRAAARLPHAEFVLLDQSGHLPMEEEPEAFLRAVLPFLERHRG